LYETDIVKLQEFDLSTDFIDICRRKISRSGNFSRSKRQFVKLEAPDLFEALDFRIVFFRYSVLFEKVIEYIYVVILVKHRRKTLKGIISVDLFRRSKLLQKQPRGEQRLPSKNPSFTDVSVYFVVVFDNKIEVVSQ